jgi:hypothetical protein
MLLAMPPRIRIGCRYIFMHALSIRRVNPTDFDGRPKRQEEPEIAQVGRLSVMTKRTCLSAAVWLNGPISRTRIQGWRDESDAG